MSEKANEMKKKKKIKIRWTLFMYKHNINYC